MDLNHRLQRCQRCALPLSYAPKRAWRSGRESNPRRWICSPQRGHSATRPAMLIMATCRGNDPLISAVTGQRLHRADSQAIVWCPRMGLNHRRRALQALALPLSYPGVWRFFCCKDWDGFSHPSCIRSQLSCSWLLPCRRLLRRSWVWSMSCSCTPWVEHALSHATHIYSRMTGFATAMSWCLHQASNPIDRRMKAVRWPTPPCRLTLCFGKRFSRS